MRGFPRPRLAANLRASPQRSLPGAGTLRGSPHPHRRRPLCGKPRTLSCCPRCQNWPGGPAGGGYSAGNPAPSRAAHAAFSLYWPSGRGLVAWFLGWLCGHLFAVFSLYRCSFMTERTKGPAVSMRRPPTRGPQDPWTPRDVVLAAIFGGCCGAPP